MSRSRIPAVFVPWRPSWLHRFAAARSDDVRKLFASEPEAPKWVAQLDRSRRDPPAAPPAGIP